MSQNTGFYTLWIINEISATYGQYVFMPQAEFWSWVSNDQSLKVSAYRNNSQVTYPYNPTNKESKLISVEISGVS